MKHQTYMNPLNHIVDDICDLTVDLRVNSTGVVHDSTHIENRRIRQDFYLIYVLDGKMNIEFCETKTEMLPGDLVVLRPGTDCFYWTEPGGFINYIWIHFTGRLAEATLSRFGIPANEITRCGQMPKAMECWKNLFHEFALHDAYFDSMTVSIFTEILGIIARSIAGGANQARLIKSIFYIHENYMKNISIVHLAEQEFLSPSHFRAVFKEITGESPSEYILSRRVVAAAEMLENSSKSLHEIAEQVGFCDVYYFGRQFKKKMGIAPGKYRKNKS